MSDDLIAELRPMVEEVERCRESHRSVGLGNADRRLQSWFRCNARNILAALERLPTATEEGVLTEELLSKAMYDDWPLTVISEALRNATGKPTGSSISWEESIKLGADHSGLRRLARAAIAAFARHQSPTAPEEKL